MPAANAKQISEPAAIDSGAANATMSAAALEGHGVCTPEKVPRTPMCGEGKNMGGFVCTPTLLAET